MTLRLPRVSRHGEIHKQVMNSRSIVKKALFELGFSGKPVCVHASIRSFGGAVSGGPVRILEDLLDEGCTVLVPSFSSAFAIRPPDNLRVPRNGCDYRFLNEMSPVAAKYTTDSDAIDDYLGIFPATVVSRSDRFRGNNPLNSFAAVGPLAEKLVSGQKPLDVYAPLRALSDLDGSVALMGVGLDSMTLLHLAEQLAGRAPFRRWAVGADGEPTMVQTGGCSRGFTRLEPILGQLFSGCSVGSSRWRVFPAAETVARAAEAIRDSPEITRCDDPDCLRCSDAILGGPILDT